MFLWILLSSISLFGVEYEYSIYGDNETTHCFSHFYSDDYNEDRFKIKIILHNNYIYAEVSKTSGSAFTGNGTMYLQKDSGGHLSEYNIGQIDVTKDKVIYIKSNSKISNLYPNWSNDKMKVYVRFENGNTYFRNYNAFYIKRTVKISAPSKPTRETPKDNSETTDTTPYFNWSSESGATSYKFYLYDYSSNNYIYNGQTTTSSDFTSKTLDKNHKYNWWVSACNSSGCSKVGSSRSDYNQFEVNELENNEPIFESGSISDSSFVSGSNIKFTSTWDNPEDKYIIDVKVRYKKTTSSNWIEKTMSHNSEYTFTKTLSIIGSSGNYEYQFKASNSNTASGTRTNTTGWKTGGTFKIEAPKEVNPTIENIEITEKDGSLKVNFDINNPSNIELIKSSYILDKYQDIIKNSEKTIKEDTVIYTVEEMQTYGIYEENSGFYININLSNSDGLLILENSEKQNYTFTPDCSKIILLKCPYLSRQDFRNLFSFLLLILPVVSLDYCKSQKELNNQNLSDL